MSTVAQTDGAPGRTQRLIGKGWIQAVALVMLFGFTVMGMLAWRTYSDSMPQPEKVVTESGETLFTTQDITEGQEIFQARGLMEYGTIVGHGGYLGPDFTAEYLRMEALSVEKQLEQSGDADAAESMKTMLRTNRYDASTGTLVWTDEQVKAYDQAVEYYTKMFGPDAQKNGLKPDLITDPTEVQQVTAFFGWTAWAAAADRPGKDYSYTNNWPAEPLVGNQPTGDLMIWSVISLIVLIGGTGIMFAIYGRWSAKIDEFDGYVFVTPEYNHGVPAALKNAFDVLYPEWGHKGIALVSYGADCGVRAVEHWRTIVANAQMHVVRGQVSFSTMLEVEQREDGDVFAPAERRTKELGNVLRQLTKPRSRDIYIWLTLKQYWLAKNNRDAYTFTWDMIAANFATKALDSNDARQNFRKEIKKAIQELRTAWPNAGITADTDGVTVTRTAPSVQQKPPRPELD